MNPKPVPIADCPPAFRIDNCVAMAHVVDVDAAATFYSRLGFDCESRYSHENGVTYFAGMISGRAKLFLSLASGSIDPSQQAVLFYMYSPDVSALRDHLLSRGLVDGGLPPGMRYPDDKLSGNARNMVFSICHPFYMPKGELRVQDLDGYTILVGQLG